MAKVQMGLSEFYNLVYERIGIKGLKIEGDLVEFDFDSELLNYYKVIEDKKSQKIQDDIAVFEVDYYEYGSARKCKISLDLRWSEFYNVLARYGGERKIELIKALRGHTGLGLAETKNIVDVHMDLILSKFKKYNTVKTLNDMGKSQD